MPKMRQNTFGGRAAFSDSLYVMATVMHDSQSGRVMHAVNNHMASKFPAPLNDVYTCVPVRTCKHNCNMYCVPVLRTGTQYRYCVPVRTCRHRFTQKPEVPQNFKVKGSKVKVSKVKVIA